MRDVWRGFLRRNNDGDVVWVNSWRWIGTDNDTWLLAAEPEDVSFAVTFDELEAERRQQRPDLRPGYGFIFRRSPYSLVETREPALYTTDHNQIAAVAAEFGRVQFATKGCAHETQHFVTPDPDFSIRVDRSDIVWVVYRKKRVKK